MNQKKTKKTAVLEPHTVHDLRIGMSKDASFPMHVTNMVAMCRQTAGEILKTFRTRDQEIMLVLWRRFFLNHLDYWAQLWSPYPVRLIVELEAVQVDCINGTAKLVWRD